MILLIKIHTLLNNKSLSIGDGSVIFTRTLSAQLRLNTNSSNYYQNILSCSKTIETNCYFTVENFLDSNDVKVCKFDFTSIETVSFTQHNNTDYAISDIAPVDDDNIIVSAFDTASTPNKFVFYSSNHSSTSVNWAVIADTFGKYLHLFCKQVTYYLRDTMISILVLLIFILNLRVNVFAYILRMHSGLMLSTSSNTFYRRQIFKYS